MAPIGREVEPRWLVELVDGEFSLDGYQNRNSGGYGAVRNTRVTTPDSFAAGGKGGFDATRYLPSATDGPDRRGWLVDLNGTIAVPLRQRFTLDLGADGFLYQGKLPTTATWGSSLDFRVGLGYSLAFKPLSGIWF